MFFFFCYVLVLIYGSLWESMGVALQVLGFFGLSGCWAASPGFPKP